MTLKAEKRARRAAEQATSAPVPVRSGNIKLGELEPQFLRHAVEKADEGHGRTLEDGSMQWGGFDTDVFHHVDELAGADGISLLCPKCFAANGGAVGTHSLHIYFAGGKVPDRVGKDSSGKTVRWNIAGGTGYDDLSLTPSILLPGPGCGWHGYITNGEATSI